MLQEENILHKKAIEVTMLFLDFLARFLGTALAPVALFISSAVISPVIHILKIMSPKRFFRALVNQPEGSCGSSFKALSLALAGTLGVGNITGVASALISGGPGAIFWMWVGAILVIPVKYAEVNLAVQFRRKNNGGFFGGAMYYIRDGIGQIVHGKFPAVLGGAFALLCCANSLITGNLVQSNAAACIFPEEHRLTCGIILGVLVLSSLLLGVKRIEMITSSLIPILTGAYMVISLFIILSNITLVPSVFAGIVKSAFNGRAVFGGALGFGILRSMRFGIMRGIFSNEAGCGTSPIAHASANTKSPHHQACFGIFEVIFDTLILCTLTALVLLIAEARFSLIPWSSTADATPVTMEAFGMLGGSGTYYTLAVSVVLFAFATIIAQIYYGVISVGYLTKRKIPQVIYSVLSVAVTVAGSVVSSPVMWNLADVIIGIMTAVNCFVIIILRSRLKSQYQTFCPR